MRSILEIKNFKCFVSQQINMSALTILVGGNGMGKSTIVQSLLLLRQCFEKRKEILLNGVYDLSLGTFDSIINSEATDNVLSFTIYDETVQIVADAKLSVDETSSDNMMMNMLDGNFSGKKVGLLAPYFYYLSAERLGPRMSQRNISLTYPNTGVHGEYTAQILYNSRFDKISEKRQNQIEKSPFLHKQVNAWLNTIIPNVEVKAESNFSMQVSQILLKNSVCNDYLQSTNIGFGISYALPIIVTGLIAQEGSCLIVENPEAHLHPAAQSAMGKFLAMLANSGLYVILETHSDHILDGIQIYAAKNGIPQDNIVINNFEIINNSVNVTSIIYDNQYQYSMWPRHFMDQSNINYMEFVNSLK